MMRAAVLGSPIEHSLSPVLHTAAYRALGLDWTYQAIECDETGLEAVLARLDDGWAGLSLTMPLKRAVLPLLDEISDLAAAVGAANTVVRRGNTLTGYNTDVAGIVEALREIGVRAPRSAVVLGAGATACAALAALWDLGLGGAEVVARDPARTGDLARAAGRLGVRATLHPWAELSDLLDPGRTDVVVSTLPSRGADGLAPLLEGLPESPPDGRGLAVLDVVYDPWPTRFALAAHRAGGSVVGGLPMLVHQAARQVELLTGRAPAPVAAMREAGERARTERARTQRVRR